MQPNRAQRRAMARSKNVQQPRIVPLPALLDEFTVFDMPQTILDQISNGSIDSVQGVPVFRDNAGVWTQIVPALEGWIFTWNMINEKLQLNLNLQPLSIVSKRLHNSVPLTKENIGAAQICLSQCRKAFRLSNRQQIVSIAQTAQIAIFMEQKKNG